MDRILSTVWADKEIAVKLLIKEPRKSRRSFSFVNKNLNSYVEVMPYFRVATRLAKVRTKYVVTWAGRVVMGGAPSSGWGSSQTVWREKKVSSEQEF